MDAPVPTPFGRTRTMDRRNFLIGAGGIAIGGSALLGSGAFSRVESHRQVSVQVANDADAYLGLAPGSSESGQNYVAEDEHGHVEIVVADSGNDGFGVNSNSITFFDNLLEICNQGKEDASVWFEPTPLVGGEDDGTLLGAAAFYTGEAQGSSGTTELTAVHTTDGALLVPVGECVEVGLAVDTGKGALDDITGVPDLDIGKVDASEAEGGEVLIDEEVTLTADVGVEPEVPVEEPGGINLPVNSDPEAESEEQFDTLSTTEFGTEAVEICVEKEGVDGETDIGVQVTDHHGTFNETPTTWNPGSSFLAPVTVEFENGTGCFTIGNPGVDGVTLTLFPFGGGLLTVDNIENVAVAVDGEEPDEMTIEGVDVPQNGTSSVGTDSDDQPFTEYEADR